MRPIYWPLLLAYRGLWTALHRAEIEAVPAGIHNLVHGSLLHFVSSL